MTSQNTGPITDKSLANLRLWPKGVSGNPGGRPKTAVLRALLEPHRRTMVATLLRLMRSARQEGVKLEGDDCRPSGKAKCAEAALRNLEFARAALARHRAG